MRTNKRLRVIRASKLIDGNGGASIKEPLLIVEGDRIKAIGTKADVQEPVGAQIIDANGCTLMPGMFDLHVHIAAFNAVTFNNYRVAISEISPQLQQFYALFHAQLCFEMGFTTLRDLGRFTLEGKFTPHLCALRDAINMGIMPGPRLLVAGRPVISGAHLELSLPRSIKRVAGMVADGPWDLRRLTREELRTGCDWIKTSASGGANANEELDIRNMTQDELDAIVDEAHAFNKYVSVHCFTPQSHRMCVRAGVDTIEHVVFTDDETVELIRDSRIPVVPTLLHRTDRAIEVMRSMGAPEHLCATTKKIQPIAFESFKVFHQAGIKIAMGTDTGYEPRMGENAKELELYVDLGMTPMEALQTATKYAAEAVHLDNDLGTLDAGKLADVVIIDGDPLQDISILQEKDKVKMVMKEGEIYVDRISGQEKCVIQCEPDSWKIIDTL